MRSPRKILLEMLVRRRPFEALALGAQALRVRSLIQALPSSSPLFRPEVAETIELPLDRTIAANVLQDGAWQVDVLAFFQAHAPAGPCLLLDVGANVGLVTREVLHTMPQVVQAVCFEPHPLNHELLARNLAHLPNCTLHRMALGTNDGELPFFVDEANAGNYSLLADAMRDRPHHRIDVPCRRASPEALLDSLPADQRDLPVIWKSDTQGFDEIIVSMLPASFWQRVKVGVMEISRLNRPEFNRSGLVDMLAQFPLRCWSDSPGKQLSVDDVLAYSRGNDDTHADLLFAR